MDITNEIKAKLFAQYIGQDVVIPKNYQFDGYQTDAEQCELVGIYEQSIKLLGISCFYPVEDFKLILKPLGKITDEDAIYVGKLMECDMKHVVRDSSGNFLFVCEKLSSRKYKGLACPEYNTSRIDLLENKTLFWDANDASDGVTGVSSEVSLACYQYLQYKGYDVTHYLLDGKTLEQSGLAIYEK